MSIRLSISVCPFVSFYLLDYISAHDKQMNVRLSDRRIRSSLFNIDVLTIDPKLGECTYPKVTKACTIKPFTAVFAGELY